MLVVDRLIHVSMYNDCATMRCFSSRAAFSELKMSYVLFAMPILTIIHVKTETILKASYQKGRRLSLHIHALPCFNYYYKTVL